MCMHPPPRGVCTLAIWREMGTARARVQQIARIVARGQWRGRYPEVLIVENATQLMDLLHNQLEAQPPGDRCWGGRNTPVDEVPIVALASDVAAWVEELFRTGYVGTVDRIISASFYHCLLYTSDAADE